MADPIAPEDEDIAENAPRSSAGPLNTAVTLTVGQLYYRDANGQAQQCVFQFNPTEMERSRNIAFTRSRTGNTLEESRTSGRNSAKRKQTRQLEPWAMSMTLRFDAAYGRLTHTRQSPLRKAPHSGELPENLKSAQRTTNLVAGNFAAEIKRIGEALQFFEAIADAEPWKPENEKIANADETPPPPYVMLAFGQRVWECAVKSVRIKEEDYTRDLYPRRFEVTLSLELIQSVPQSEQGKGTAK